MTPRKGTGYARRPELRECIALWRAAPRGAEAEPFTHYCAQVVERSLRGLERRGYDIDVLGRLLAHVADHGTVRGMRVGRLLLDERGHEAGCGARETHSLARLAWYALARELQHHIDTVPSFDALNSCASRDKN